MAPGRGNSQRSRRRTPTTTSTGRCPWTPRSSGPTNTLPEHAKKGRPTPASPPISARTLPRRTEHQGPSGRRRPRTAPRLHRHRRPGRRCTRIRDGHVPHPSAPHRSGQAPGRSGRPCVLLTCHPQPPAAPGHPRGHPAAIRPSRPPPAARPARRPPAQLRQRGRTSSGTLSSGASTTSSSGAAWPHEPTSSRSPTRQPSTSRASSSGPDADQRDRT